MSRKESKLAKCPFYKGEDKQKVYCEGIVKNSSIHLAFATVTQKKEFCKVYCHKWYGECLIAEMLFSKYEEEG